MNNYDTSDYSETPPVPPMHKDYSLEEYLRLRDLLNAPKAKLPTFSEDTTLGIFAFSFKYVLPLLLFTTIAAPFAIMTMGIMGVPMLIMLTIAVYLIYMLPKISNAMRKQEAISLAELQQEEYEAFLKKNQTLNKRASRKR